MEGLRDLPCGTSAPSSGGRGSSLLPTLLSWRPPPTSVLHPARSAGSVTAAAGPLLWGEGSAEGTALQLPLLPPTTAGPCAVPPRVPSLCSLGVPALSVPASVLHCVQAGAAPCAGSLSPSRRWPRFSRDPPCSPTEAPGVSPGDHELLHGGSEGRRCPLTPRTESRGSGLAAIS